MSKKIKLENEEDVREWLKTLSNKKLLKELADLELPSYLKKLIEFVKKTGMGRTERIELTDYLFSMKCAKLFGEA